jgi:type II secretory pathway component GspD/PulD (secretin)
VIILFITGGISRADVPQEQFSVEFKNAPVSDVIRLISEKGKINIIADTDVTGQVTVSLLNVSASEALDAIFKSMGYAIAQEGNVTRISKTQKITSRTFQVGSVSAADLEKQVSNFLSSEGKLSVSKERNSLMVMDYPDNISQIEKYINFIDAGEQQVMIEAKVVEVSLDKEHEMGIDWTWNDPDFSGWSDLTGTVSQKLKGATDVFTLAVGNDHISATLTAMMKDGVANLLSAPKIAALNGEKATIKVVQQIPYVVASTSQTTDVIVVTQTVEFRDAGITLEVTPQVGNDGYVKMKIHPKVEQFVGFTETQYPEPISNTREAETIVRVKDKQTVIIGGLIKDDTTKRTKKVPLLGNIPVVGYLFRHTSNTSEKIELVIFISPRII